MDWEDYAKFDDKIFDGKSLIMLYTTCIELNLLKIENTKFDNVHVYYTVCITFCTVLL